MRHSIRKYVLMLGLAAAVWAWNGEIRPTSQRKYDCHCGSGRGPAGDAGQLCRCSPAFHRWGARGAERGGRRVWEPRP